MLILSLHLVLVYLVIIDVNVQIKFLMASLFSSHGLDSVQQILCMLPLRIQIRLDLLIRYHYKHESV